MHKNQAKGGTNEEKVAEKEAPGKVTGERIKEQEEKARNQGGKDGAVVGDINGEGKRTKKSEGKAAK